ncbi:hypothetical protein NB691_003158 [Xanthomonas sacchari]|nr:hypothetical protein [Xanthomonas sacchari]
MSGAAQTATSGVSDLPVQWACTRRLTEDDWERIAAVLPGRRRARAGHAGDTRRFIESVLWVADTGLHWNRMPPDAFGRWHGAYVRFVRWAQEGVWRQVEDALQEQALRGALAALVAAYLDRRQRRDLLLRLEGAAARAPAERSACSGPA